MARTLSREVWRNPSKSRCFALLVALTACSTQHVTGRVDAGSSDAALPDAGGGDAGRCITRCGPSRACCGEGAECVGDLCMPTCEGSRCGADDSICCATGVLCVNGSCATPRAACIDDVDCGATEYCDLGIDRCLPRPTEVCEYRPDEDTLDAELVWEWTGGNVISTPLVVQLTDDNRDGSIDDNDRADVVAITYEGAASQFGLVRGAKMVALNGRGGTLIWRSSHPAFDLCAAASPAAADLDGDGTTELVVLGTPVGDGGCPLLSPLDINDADPNTVEIEEYLGASDVRVIVLSHEGEIEWTASDPLQDTVRYSVAASFAVADLDGDGTGEIIWNGTVFEHDGSVRFSSQDMWGGYAGWIPFAANVDADPELEIVQGHGVWNHDGTPLWHEPLAYATAVLGRVLPTPAGPQLIAADTRYLHVRDPRTGAALIPPFEYGAAFGFVGAPTLADFDGDGAAEVGLSSMSGHYVVIDFAGGNASVLWRHDVAPEVGAPTVGSSVFDFDGNGRAEVVWANACLLRVLRGTDGEELLRIPHRSVTLWEEPVVADLTGDGSADIVVGANYDPLNFGGDTCPGVPVVTGGLRVYRSASQSWIAARSVWNQHAYSYDNIADDLSLPRTPRASWETHNTFRANRYPNPETVFLAPDLRVTTLGAIDLGCPGHVILRARVQNVGARSAPQDTAVKFFARDGATQVDLGSVRLAELLAPGGAVWLELDVRDIPENSEGLVEVTVHADDDGSVPLVRGAVNECIESNNAATLMLDCRLI